MKKPLAYLSLTNTLGMVILDIIYDIDDYVVTAYQSEHGLSDEETSVIHYEEESPYFYRTDHEKPYYINEFMRTNL